MFQQIHPAIKRFFESDDFTVEPRLPDPSTIMYWDQVAKDRYIHKTIALTYNQDPTIYYFQGSVYSEEEMLKIVKLKAFL